MHRTNYILDLRLLCIAIALCDRVAFSAEPVDFQRDVWPILQTRCLQCHGPEKQHSSLRMDTPAALFKGGDSGPAVVSGDASKSLLLERVSSQDDELRMPQEEAPLSAAQIDTLRRWITEGAGWPADFVPVRPETLHWAFQPVARPAITEITNQEFTSHNPIDAFVTAKLTERGLVMSAPADARTLICRITLDLTGLPPTPEEVEDYVAACSAAKSGQERSLAWEKVIDGLLASPRYGERWAQHWLDVIRYADTTGYEANSIRPNAWPYRDYVIAALNSDVSYPRFILEQLAGDTLGIDPATGFLVTAPFPSRIEIGQEAAAIAQTRYNGLDEVAQNIGSAMLGISVGCARCHDHKFDPVSTRDYYRLVAAFSGLQFVERPWLGDSLPTDAIAAAQNDLAEIQRQLHALPAWRETEPISTADGFSPVTAKWIRLTVRETYVGQPYAPAIDELEVWTVGKDGEPPRNVAAAEAGGTARSSGPDVSLGARDEFLNDGKSGRQSRWVSGDRLDKIKAWVEIELPQPTLVHQVRWTCDYDDQGNDLVAAKWRTMRRWVVEVSENREDWQAVVPEKRDEGLAESDVKRRNSLESQYSRAAKRLWELTHIFAGRFRDAEPCHVLGRGDPAQQREPTGAGGIEVLGGYELPLDAPEAERRAALAQWLGSDRHPLTARVLVNRVWRHHFGAGLVDTPSDFGAQGERPSHPELLDWLASEFMARGWKLKELHKLICMSDAYRQGSRPEAAAMSIDPAGRLLWRFPPQRLDADSIRDSILFVSGSLDLTMGGPGVSVYKPQPKPDSGEWAPKELPGPETWRRTIYLLRVRGADDGLFKPFDLPDCGQVRAKRSLSTTPLQALNLLNSPFIIEQSRQLATRAEREAGADRLQQVDRVFALTLLRAPSDRERSACVAVAEQHGLETVCRALFNSNEFLFLE